MKVEKRPQEKRGVSKSMGVGWGGDVLYEKGRKDSGGQRTGSRGMGKNMGARIHRSNV